MPMAARPKARSRWPRCRATCSPPSRWRRGARGISGATNSRASSKPTRNGLPSGSRRRSGAPSCNPTRSRSTARRSRAASARRMPARCCSPASRGRTAPSWSRTSCCSPRFFSGWGIRTVARGEARYNPMSYHNGSVWPHDNALIALGFARYGFKRAVGQVMQGLFEAATYMDLRRLPELFCGFQRERRRGPTLYPVACAPQAWASATPFSLIEAALGLEFRPQTQRNPPAQSAAAAIPRRGDPAQSSGRRIEHRPEGAPPRRRSVARGRCGASGKFRRPSSCQHDCLSDATARRRRDGTAGGVRTFLPLISGGKGR